MADSVAATKRVAALTGYMLGVLVVAGSAGLYRLDAESFRADAQALLALQRLDLYLAGHDPTTDQMPMRRTATRYLERSHPDLHDRMIASRQVLTDHLVIGLDGHEPFGCDQFAQVAVEGKSVAEARIADSGWSAVDPADIIPFALLSLSSPWLEHSRDAGFEERGTVAELLDRVADARAPVHLRVAGRIALDPVAAAACPPTPATHPQQTYRLPGVLYFAGAGLVEDAVVVRFEGTPPQQIQQQSYGLWEEVPIAAEVTEVEGPSATALVGDYGDRDSRLLAADLDRMGSRPASLARLRADYGYLPIGFAVSTAGAALVEGNAGASLLGLRVTARRLALVVSLAAIGISTALLAEAVAAGAAGRPLRDAAPDGLRALLASTVAGRLLVWSVAPAAAILLAAPPTWWWAAAAGLAAGLGAAATTVAERTDRAGTGDPGAGADAGAGAPKRPRPPR